LISRHKIAWLAPLALVLVIALIVRPGHHDATAQASGSGVADHPRLADVTARRVRAEHVRARLALELAKVPAHSTWLASWASAPQAPSPENTFATQGFDNQTIREITLVSSNGAAVRVHLSNRYGTRPLLVGRASVAVASSFGRLATAAKPLTFGGADYVTIPAGGSVVSDPAVIDVHALQRLAVSLYLPESTGPLTYHGSAEQSGFLGHGDDVLRADGGWTTDDTASWYLLTGVDTLSPPTYVGTVAAMGDSITAGFHSTLNTFGAWPDDLARRFSRVTGDTMAVIDEGISGNRLLNPAACCGPSGLNRFSADVLGQAGVRDVILLEGTNDIGFSRDHTALTAPHTDVSVDDIIAGDQRVIAATHRAGLRIFGATLLPFKGAGYWTVAGEEKRDALNDWILHSGAFDGVINFAAVMAAPGHPQVLNPIYNSGDHLHPNNRGYERMANAVQLAVLTAAASSDTSPSASPPARPRTAHGAAQA
jgi:lysophospholipase L1-like esterase